MDIKIRNKFIEIKNCISDWFGIFVTNNRALWSGLAQSVAHRTLGRRVPGSIPVRGVVCCGLEQVTFPQLNVYSVDMFIK